MARCIALLLCLLFSSFKALTTWKVWRPVHFNIATKISDALLHIRISSMEYTAGMSGIKCGGRGGGANDCECCRGNVAAAFSSLL